jgi:hypothetical protein
LKTLKKRSRLQRDLSESVIRLLAPRKKVIRIANLVERGGSPVPGKRYTTRKWNSGGSNLDSESGDSEGKLITERRRKGKLSAQGSTASLTIVRSDEKDSDSLEDRKNIASGGKDATNSRGAKDVSNADCKEDSVIDTQDEENRQNSDAIQENENVTHEEDNQEGEKEDLGDGRHEGKNVTRDQKRSAKVREQEDGTMNGEVANGMANVAMPKEDAATIRSFGIQIIPGPLVKAQSGNIFRPSWHNGQWISPNFERPRRNSLASLGEVSENVVGFKLPVGIVENLTWVEHGGRFFKPLGPSKSWMCSNGLEYKYDDHSHRWKAGNGSIWSGPAEQDGRFAGLDFVRLKGHMLFYIDYSGVVYTAQCDGTWRVLDGSTQIVPEKVGGLWVRSSGEVFRHFGGRWITKLGVTYVASRNGWITTDGRVYSWNSGDKCWKTEKGETWNGAGKEDGIWIDDKGNPSRMIDVENGKWIDNDGNFMEKGPNGEYYKTDGTVWNGPPSEGEFELRHRLSLVTEDGLVLRPRAGTPLGMYGRQKLSVDSPRNRGKGVCTAPSPNIIFDPVKVAVMVRYGVRQFAPVLQRLGWWSDVSKRKERKETSKKIVIMEPQGSSQSPRKPDRITVQEVTPEFIPWSSEIGSDQLITKNLIGDERSVPSRRNTESPTISGSESTSDLLKTSGRLARPAFVVSPVIGRLHLSRSPGPSRRKVWDFQTVLSNDQTP